MAYNNAFSPERKNTGRSVLSSTLGQGGFHSYAIRCLSSCNVFSIDVFMLCNLQSERAKFPNFFCGGMPPNPPRKEWGSHGNPPFQIVPTPLFYLHVQCCAVTDWNVHFFSPL